MSLLTGRFQAVLKHSGWLLAGLIGLMACSILGYLILKEWSLLVMPFIFLALVWGIKDFRILFLLLWATIPFSIEMDLPGGLSTDFPVEPLMWLCSFLVFGYLFLRAKEIDFSFVYHPVWILLLLHFFWIIITSITSQEPLHSFKFTLAKGWYLLCFVLIPILLFKKSDDYRTWGLFLFIPLILSVIVILYRHSQLGFTFPTINNAVIPIYRNHVDYACALGILIPFAWWLFSQSNSFWLKLFYTGSMGIMLVGIYFSYTRAAWVCVPLAIGCYVLIRLRLMRVMIPVALALVILLVSWMAYDNRYIGFSPNYEKTITHNKFDDLVSATYRMEDISTVERFYRWVAGYYMIRERPWLGFGPSSFYNVYHNYVDRHFTTYVSDNPEHSGIHNYYLMVAVEQGLIGLLIFVLLLIAVLITGEKIYHRMKPGAERGLLMTALVSFCCSLFIMTLNDTVETDKLGTFFFLCMAIVVHMHMQERKTVRE